MTLFLTSFLRRESPVLPESLKLRLISEADVSRGVTVDMFVDKLKRQRTDGAESSPSLSSVRKSTATDSLVEGNESLVAPSSESLGLQSSAAISESAAVITCFPVDESTQGDANTSISSAAHKGDRRPHTLTDEQVAFLSIASKQMKKDETTINSVLPSQFLMEVDFDVRMLLYSYREIYYFIPNFVFQHVHLSTNQIPMFTKPYFRRLLPEESSFSAVNSRLDMLLKRFRLSALRLACEI